MTFEDADLRHQEQRLSELAEKLDELGRHL